MFVAAVSSLRTGDGRSFSFFLFTERFCFIEFLLPNVFLLTGLACCTRIIVADAVSVLWSGTK